MNAIAVAKACVDQVRGFAHVRVHVVVRATGLVLECAARQADRPLAPAEQEDQGRRGDREAEEREPERDRQIRRRAVRAAIGAFQALIDAAVDGQRSLVIDLETAAVFVLVAGAGQ